LVVDVVWLFGEKGLHLQGLDHRPTDGWRASRFRKVWLQSAECTLESSREGATG
jgi:hypothetical protein